MQLAAAILGTLTTLSHITAPASASVSEVKPILAKRLTVQQFAPEGYGTVVRYRPGVMERVRDYRARKGQLKIRWDVAGWAAVPDCKMLGKIVTLTKWGRSYRFQIVDCSAPWDWRTHTLHGTRPWAEIDGRAARWFIGSAGRTKAYIDMPY